MATGTPNILLVMSDQHRADVMGCAGDASALTPSLDALAAQGVRYSRVSCQGPLCMPARASFMTERYVRDHGVYTNSSEIPPDSPTYAWALREAGYHTALLGKAHLYLDEQLTVPHMDDMAGRLEALGFAEVFETGDKFVGKIPTRYTDYLSGLGPARRLQEAHRRPQLPGRERGRPERDQVRPDVGLHADAHPAGVLRRRLARPAGGASGSRATTARSRSSSSWGSPGRMTPGTRRRRPWSGTAASTSQCPARPGVPTIEGTGRYGALLNSFLWLSDSETMTDDAIRGMRTSYAADISVIDQAVGDMVGALERKGLLDTHVDHLHQRPRRDGRQPRHDVEVRPVRAGRARAADRPSPGRLRAACGRFAGRASRRAGDRARHRRSARRRALRGTLAPGQRARPGRGAARVGRRSARTGASPPSRPSATSWWSTRTRWSRASSSTCPRMPPRTTTFCPIRRRDRSWRRSWRPTSARSSGRAPARPIPSIFTGGYD